MAWMIRSALGAVLALTVVVPGPASADSWRGHTSFHGSVGIGFGARYPYPWYPYGAPVYPYPAYPYGYPAYTYPPTYPYPTYPYPTYVPPPVVAPAPVPAPAQTWYACDDPQGYYPYVNQCNVPWRQVPVTPSTR